MGCYCATFYFYSDLFAYLGDGYKVTVCCDPASPHLGAAILNREQGARAQVDRDSATPGRPYRADQLICIAEAVDRVPQFSATTQWDDTASFERRKRYREQCRLQYRAIMPFGRQQAAAAKATEHRDGRGNVATAAINAGRTGIEAPAQQLGERPVSPAIAARAARLGTKQLMAAAAANLTAADLSAGGECEEPATYSFKPGEIADLLGS
jgi:hypothetical protein